MSLSNEWTERHLTPRGWERGDEKSDSAQVRTRLNPLDRVQTWLYRDKLTHRYEGPDRGASCIWSGGDPEEASRLVEIYGSCPQNL